MPLEEMETLELLDLLGEQGVGVKGMVLKGELHGREQEVLVLLELVCLGVLLGVGGPIMDLPELMELLVQLMEELGEMLALLELVGAQEVELVILEEVAQVRVQDLEPQEQVE